MSPFWAVRLVLYHFDDDEDGLERIDLVGEEEWADFECLPIFKDDRGQDVTTIPDLPSGVCVFFCPRSHLDLDGHAVPHDEEEDGAQPEAELSDIFLQRPQWEKITSRFHLHSFLSQAIKRKTTTAATLYKIITRLNGVERGDVDKNAVEAETLWMLTVMTSADFQHNFALSATQFDERCLTLMVVLGATDEQVQKVEDLLRNADDALGHPLLMLGLCAELLLQHMQDIVEDAVDKCIETTRTMRPQSLSIGSVPSTNQVISFMDRVQRNRRRSQQIEDEVKLTKAYLTKQLPKKAVTDGNLEDREIDEVTERFYERFEYIFLEMDALMSKSKIYADEMSFNAETIRGEISRREAISGARLAGASVVIAVVATFYLPITSIATIFAMPVFDFKNDWRDWRYKPVPSTKSNNSSTTGEDRKPAEELPVFSGYFWIYAAIAIGTMFFTFFLCWMFIGGTSADDPDGTKHPFRRHMRNIFDFIMEPPSWTQLKKHIKGYVALRIAEIKGTTRLKGSSAEKPKPNPSSPSPTHGNDMQDQSLVSPGAVELRTLSHTQVGHNSVGTRGGSRAADDLV